MKRLALPSNSLLLGLLVLLLAAPPSSATRSGPHITVFAAASLTDVFPRIDPGPRYSFAGSDQLALQLQQGAPADVFAAASPRYPERLYHAGVVRKPVLFATNRLVVIVPRSNPARLSSVYDLRREGVRVVVGDDSVPIGAYTKQILDTLRITSQVAKNVVSRESDVKGIVAKVALGEADAGFVYATDAKAVAAKVRVINLPAWAQPPIRYELAIVKSAEHAAAARSFVHGVLSRRGRLLLKRAGFGLPKIVRR